MDPSVFKMGTMGAAHSECFIGVITPKSLIPYLVKYLLPQGQSYMMWTVELWLCIRLDMYLGCEVPQLPQFWAQHWSVLLEYFT